jgi:hypothetical protein
MLFEYYTIDALKKKIPHYYPDAFQYSDPDDNGKDVSAYIEECKNNIKYDSVSGIIDSTIDDYVKCAIIHVFGETLKQCYEFKQKLLIYQITQYLYKIVEIWRIDSLTTEQFNEILGKICDTYKQNIENIEGIENKLIKTNIDDTFDKQQNKTLFHDQLRSDCDEIIGTIKKQLNIVFSDSVVDVIDDNFCKLFNDEPENEEQDDKSESQQLDEDNEFDRNLDEEIDAHVKPKYAEINVIDCIQSCLETIRESNDKISSYKLAMGRDPFNNDELFSEECSVLNDSDMDVCK